MCRITSKILIAITIASISACSKDELPLTSQALKIRQPLANVQGVYTLHPGTKQYQYSHKRHLKEILSKHNKHVALVELVECLDDETESQSTFDGEALPLGMICYETLTQLIYYEPTTPDGDIAINWVGYIQPNAITSSKMESAKEAWKKVLEKKGYSFL